MAHGRERNARAVERIALVVALATSGCATAASVRAAEAGDFPALRAALAREWRAGELDDGRARDVAHAVASGEIERARSRSGVETVRAFEPCARELDGALKHRMRGIDDEPAAASALLRVDARELDADDAGDVARDHEKLAQARRGGDAIATAWRAVLARSLVEERDAPLRRRLFVDGDEDVRLAALHAASEAADPRETEAVLEAARVDPNPRARIMAVHAAAAIGGERVVLALKDLWATANEETRIAIAEAWASPRCAPAGGHRELVLAMQAIPGEPAIASASLLARVREARSPAARRPSARDVQDAAEAVGVLTRAIETGAARDRIYAMGLAPLAAPTIRAAMIKAQSDPDDTVAIAAIGRLVETPGARGGLAERSAERAAAIAKLLAAANGSTASALAAKAALGRAKVAKAIPLLYRDLSSGDLRVRETAGLALVDAGEARRAAFVTADTDAHIRARVSCAIVRERR